MQCSHVNTVCKNELMIMGYLLLESEETKNNSKQKPDPARAGPQATEEHIWRDPMISDHGDSEFLDNTK